MGAVTVMVSEDVDDGCKGSYADDGIYMEGVMGGSVLGTTAHGIVL